MRRKKTKNNKRWWIAAAAGVAAFGLLFFWFWQSSDAPIYDRGTTGLVSSDLLAQTTSNQKEEPKLVVTHKKTPTVVKAVYMSSWVAATKNIRERLINNLAGTEINSIVIDVKDYSGAVSMDINTKTAGQLSGRVKDLAEFVDYLHQKNYYVIGRISVFQDNLLSRQRPDLALKRLDNGALWTDRKGIAWLDVSAPEVWDYTIAVAKEAHRLGFDELNFDYIRFPSDGNTSNVAYPYSRLSVDTRAEALRKFFVYLNAKMKEIDAPISADVFGMVATNTDDLGIGQVLENAIPYFDYVAPMVYPSHYPPGFLNYKNPASVPYEIVKHSMGVAVTRVVAQGYSPLKLRPWLQDFDLGADYTAEMIKAQKRAVYDAGLTSWMMWDPANIYTVGAYR
ncbi:MAG TPA: putative glycoside hydrolase [Candidatus Paceibacterota bacterium]|nr:putative glycoside hydrolase [Candidatus Paceibacterota bacterium]HQI26208.1 putative glycoside hydrolase [Candidatus Paceibacterota bacterium]HQJ84035.1 putative glycoside hydrolase [Candidatus Paceibacterota bacterium]